MGVEDVHRGVPIIAKYGRLNGDMPTEKVNKADPVDTAVCRARNGPPALVAPCLDGWSLRTDEKFSSGRPVRPGASAAANRCCGKGEYSAEL